MKQREATFIVTFPLPKHATMKMAKTYIEGALICWCDHVNFDDPMGEINIDKIKVKSLGEELNVNRITVKRLRPQCRTRATR